MKLLLIYHEKKMIFFISAVKNMKSSGNASLLQNTYLLSKEHVHRCSLRDSLTLHERSYFYYKLSIDKD